MTAMNVHLFLEPLAQLRTSTTSCLVLEISKVGHAQSLFHNLNEGPATVLVNNFLKKCCSTTAGPHIHSHNFPEQFTTF